MTWKLRTILPVWLLVAVGAVLVAIFSPRTEYFTWIPAVMGVAVIVSFVIQLAVLQKDGLVFRMMVSLSGSVVLLAIATAILAPLSI